MNERFVIHVRLRQAYDGREDYYFGSMAAIYDVLPEAVVGIKYDILANCFAKRGHRLETPKCIITRGSIHRKKQTNKN